MVIVSHFPRIVAELSAAVFLSGIPSDGRAASIPDGRILPDIEVFGNASAEQLGQIRHVDWHLYTDAQLREALDKLALRQEFRIGPVKYVPELKTLSIERLGTLNLWRKAIREYASRTGRLPDAVSRFQKAVENAADVFENRTYLRLAALSLEAEAARVPDRPTARTRPLTELAKSRATQLIAEETAKATSGKGLPPPGDHSYSGNREGFRKLITRGLTDATVTPAELRKWTWDCPCGTGSAEFDLPLRVAVPLAALKCGERDTLGEQLCGEPDTLMGPLCHDARASERRRRTTLARLEAFAGMDAEAEWLARLYVARDLNKWHHDPQQALAYETASRGGDEVVSALSDWLEGARGVPGADNILDDMRRLFPTDGEKCPEVQFVEFDSRFGLAQLPGADECVGLIYRNGMRWQSWNFGLRLRLVPPDRAVSPEVRSRFLALVHPQAKARR